MSESDPCEQLPEDYATLITKCLQFLRDECEKEAKVMQATDGIEKDGWVLKGTKDGVEKAQLNSQWARGSDFVCVRGRMKMKHSPARILELILDCEGRTAWDDALDQGSFVKSFTGNADMIRLIYQGMWPVWQRDLCLLRGWGTDASGACWLVAQSVVDTAVPEEPGKYVRATLGACGYMMTPTADGCQVSYISQTKFKGFIPVWMNNTICEQQPMSLAKMDEVLNNWHSTDVGLSVGRARSNPQVLS